ncbi:MAG TPA: hypothetical protein ENJ00_07440 [Phycisphaerales bacterium]|nr:hypothetical protein [Phycisphaerales bacterium]
MGIRSKAPSKRLHMPRNAERFHTNTLTCPIGTVRDVSETGFRLSSRKKFALKKGETHSIKIRSGSKQISMAVRVQWVRRVCWFPAAYEAGFQIIDPRPGVGQALRQLGQFGFASTDQQPTGADRSHNKSGPHKKAEPSDRPSAFVEMENLYDILKVDRSATASEIKSAYRRLVKLYHPDHNSDENAVEVFELISKAYSVLRDPTRRAWYDKMLDNELAA